MASCPCSQKEAFYWTSILCSKRFTNGFSTGLLLWQPGDYILQIYPYKDASVVPGGKKLYVALSGLTRKHVFSVYFQRLQTFGTWPKDLSPIMIASEVASCPCSQKEAYYWTSAMHQEVYHLILNWPLTLVARRYYCTDFPYKTCDVILGRILFVVARRGKTFSMCIFRKGASDHLT